jgi:VWFA-related protein
MRTFRIVCLAWCAVLTTGLFGQAQTPTFRAVASGVTVDVSVQMGSRPVTNLQIGDFELQDNGVPQAIADLTYGKLPIDITVALDISYSVRGTMLERLRKAVGQLMRDLRKDDRLRLMMFNARVARVVDYSSDPDVIDAAMTTAVAGGGTSLNDAISLALVSARAPGRRQLVVVFTDGTDATSTTSMVTLAEVANRTTATLTVVTPSAIVTGGNPFGFTSNPALAGLPTVTTTGNTRVGIVRSAYVGLTSSTGGSVVPFQVGEDLGAVFRRVLDAFRSTYVLHFVPTGVAPGGFHELTVTVKRPNARVIARRGYFGG